MPLGLPGILDRPATRRGGTAQVIPGFGLTLGVTICYLSLIVLIPLSAAFLKAAGLG
jgi:sulfate transport system permease protein